MSNLYPRYLSALGIGKSNAEFPLDVVGDVNFTGSLRSNGVLLSMEIPSNITVDNVDAKASATLSVGANAATTTLNLGTNGGTQAINMGTGSGVKTITIGGGTDDAVTINGNLTVSGTTISVNSSNAVIMDKIITLNKGGAAASGGLVGLEVEEAGTSNVGYLRTNAARDAWVAKAPNGAEVTIGGLSSQFVTNGSNVYLPSGSNLGVGKSNADYPLDVVGSINFTGDLLQNGMAYSSGTNSQFATISGSNVALLGGSNLAIGKSNAAYALDVVGDINMTGALRTNGALYAPDVIIASGMQVARPSGSTGAFFYETSADKLYFFTSMWREVLMVPNISLEILLIAGGASGGGGATGGGGGGAGELYFNNNVYVTPGLSFNITIGTGGTSTTTTAGNNGGNSSFVGSSINYLVYGGGGGAYSLTLPGKTGGSGGGAADSVYAYVEPRSNIGLVSYGGLSGSGGGGGGGGGSGSSGGSWRDYYNMSPPASYDTSGGGGTGYTNASITTMATVTNTGNGYFAAGGSGGNKDYAGRWATPIVGPAYDGGGTGASLTVAATSATSYGSGGGGASTSKTTSGAGRQGLCIVRYQNAYLLPNSLGGSKYSSGNYTYHCYTTSGTLTF